jgi:hypothetical protein
MSSTCYLVEYSLSLARARHCKMRKYVEESRENGSVLYTQAMSRGGTV